MPGSTGAAWRASSTEQPTAKSLSIGWAATGVPGEQAAPRAAAATQAGASAPTRPRMKLSLDLVARLSTALGPARPRSGPTPKQVGAGVAPAISSLPDTATLWAGEHHAMCGRAPSACSPLESQPEAGRPAPAAPSALGAAGEPGATQEARWLQTRDGFYTTATTKTTILLPGSLSASSSPLPLPAPGAASAAAAAPNPGRQAAAWQDSARKVVSPEASLLNLHWDRRCITEPAVVASQPHKTPALGPPTAAHLPTTKSSLSRLRCPPAPPLTPQASAASRRPLDRLRHNLTNSQNHILFSIEQRQPEKAPGLRKSSVMRRPWRRPHLARDASLAPASICDTNNNNNTHNQFNHCGRRPTCASAARMRPWMLALTLQLLLTLAHRTANATLPGLNDTTSPATSPGAADLGPLEPPAQQGDTGGPFSRFLEFLRIFVMVAIIVGDICGNSLVILSVCRHSKLRVTTNWFVVSLACADILVALFAMTFNASVVISGRWLFGRWVCDFWNSCDVLASTASILHLCCISIDRYIAITRPLDYPMKITTRRVMYALCAVWVSSALLSYLPIFTGVYTTSEHIEWLKANPDQCEFTVNRVYAIVSSSVSFWIPSSIMVFTYYRIYREASRQEKFIYKAQSMLPAPMPHSNHHNSTNNNNNNRPRSKRHRSKSVAVGALANSRQQSAKQVGGGDLGPNTATTSLLTTTTTSLHSSGTGSGTVCSGPGAAGSIVAISGAATATAGSLDQLESTGNAQVVAPKPPATLHQPHQQQQQLQQLAEEQDSNSGHSTPTKRSISKMKREHKAAKTLGIIMGVFILCWLPFFSWYTPMHICGSACHRIVPPEVVPILFWIGYFNSTLNPIIYAYFNHDFRDAFKKTLQWIFCCCNDLKCLRVNRPNDNQHYNCTYRSTQEIGLVSNS